VTSELTHEARTRLLGLVLRREFLKPGTPFPCPYRPGQEAQLVGFANPVLAPGVYHSLMDLNFRRNGTVLYRPQCVACDECRAIRVPADAFRLSRSQKRCRVRNTDVTVDVGVPIPTDEKYAVYQRYLIERHDGAMDGSLTEFRGFLYESCANTIEITYRAGGRLVAVGIADAEPEALSAVYCYFDPAEAGRSLGTFNVLWMIDECRRRRLPHLYLGYFVRGCRKMDYKSAFRPYELLDSNGLWVSRETVDTGPR